MFLAGVCSWRSFIGFDATKSVEIAPACCLFEQVVNLVESMSARRGVKKLVRRLDGRLISSRKKASSRQKLMALTAETSYDLVRKRAVSESGV